MPRVSINPIITDENIIPINIHFEIFCSCSEICVAFLMPIRRSKSARIKLTSKTKTAYSTYDNDAKKKFSPTLLNIVHSRFLILIPCFRFLCRMSHKYHIQRYLCFRNIQHFPHPFFCTLLWMNTTPYGT